ncbi:MAG: hypothetical protein WC635_02045 [Bacteriovorax sp.]|jgi:hypothetical protein
MKKILVLLSLITVTSTFANTVSIYRFDDVDAVIANGKTISVEDLRDGFAIIRGVQVNEDTVSLNNESKALILLRNPISNKLFGVSTMGAKIGGDGGGG